MFLLWCCCRQTEGPTGPLIASSNPEYLSANDGKTSAATNTRLEESELASL